MRSLPLIDFNKIFYNIIVTLVLKLTYLTGVYMKSFWEAPKKAYAKRLHTKLPLIGFLIVKTNFYNRIRI